MKNRPNGTFNPNLRISECGFRTASVRWLLAALVFLGLGAMTEQTAFGAKILLIVNSIVDAETPTNPNDFEVRDLLVSQGHTVNVADDTVVAAADTVGFDLVIISSSVGSGEAGVAGLSRGQFRSSRQPVICYEPALWDELLFQRSDQYNNAGGQNLLGIVAANGSHPLAAGKSGTIEIVEPGFLATVNSSQLPIEIGSDAILVATNATTDVAGVAGRAAIWAFERGSRLADDATVTAGRKVAFFYNASTEVGAYNQTARDLFLAAVTWSLTVPVDAPIVALLRAPGAVDASPTPVVRVELEDSGTSKVNTNTIAMSFNGVTVSAPTITRSGTVTSASFQPAGLLAAGSTNTVRVVYANQATPAATFTNAFQFVVTSYASLPASFAYPATAADSGAPGFRARVVQANTFNGTLPNSSARAESQLAGTLIDPITTLPYDNEANPTGAETDGYFVDPDVINWNQDAQGFGAEQGNFRDPGFPDEPIPGIPGLDGFNTDNIAAEVLTYLELSAGAHTLGVNSDDGFAVFSGVDPRDVLRLRLGAFEGSRGSADTLFTFVAPVAGIYPFRVLWYEGNGGANLEFFSIDPATGQKVLVNDRANPSAIRAWRRVTAPSRPYVSAAAPRPGETKAPLESALDFTFTNQALSVNTNTVRVSLNGQAVALTGITVSGATTRVVADPPGNLKSSTDYTVRLVYSDSGNPANSVTNDYAFSTLRAPINLPPIQQTDAGLIVIEAENFDANTNSLTHAWEFDKTPAGYTGDGTMYALPDAPGAVIDYPASLTDSPRLDYKVNFVKTGPHYFWFRGSDGGGNSINAGVDGDSPNPTMDNIDQGCCGTRLVPGGTSYTWVGGIDGTPEGRSQFIVGQAGVHTINIWMREDGQIVDKILITTDPNYIPSGAGPDQNGRVGEKPPTVSITSPTEGQNLAENSNITITVNAMDTDGNVALVEFFANGVKIGESATSPFSLTWNNVTLGGYTLSAKATDNSGLTASSTPISVVVGNPAKVLFLHGASPTASDDLIVARLRERGFLVTSLAAPGSQTSDANGQALIVISSTVASGDVVKFASAAVPIVNWEPAVYDEFGIEANNVNGVTIASQTMIEIVDATHPLAAGLSGVTTVYSAGSDLTSLDAIVAGAKVVARSVEANPRPVLFAIEKGDPLNPARLATAPARRVGFFFGNNTYVAATADGKKLFDAAVDWALGRELSGTAPALMIRRQNADVVISWEGNGTLESTATLGDPASWAPVANNDNPFTTSTAGAARFYRLRRP